MSLPKEIYFHIFTFCDLQELIKLSLTCSTFSKLISSSAFWTKFCKKHLQRINCTRKEKDDLGFTTDLDFIKYVYPYIFKPIKGIHLESDSNMFSIPYFILKSAWNLPKIRNSNEKIHVWLRVDLGPYNSHIKLISILKDDFYIPSSKITFFADVLQDESYYPGEYLGSLEKEFPDFIIPVCINDKMFSPRTKIFTMKMVNDIWQLFYSNINTNMKAMACLLQLNVKTQDSYLCDPLNEIS